MTHEGFLSGCVRNPPGSGEPGQSLPVARSPLQKLPG
jgi:hypothetical protein